MNNINHLDIRKQTPFQSGVRTPELSSQKGFTLIELLVTIAIIGVLSSILLVNLQGFRERTRDTERKRDVKTIQTALELYRSDTSGYPASLPNCNASLANGTVVYMRQVPCDPMTNAKYSYSLTGSTYLMFACLENVNDSEKDTVKQGSCSVASYTVQSP